MEQFFEAAKSLAPGAIGAASSALVLTEGSIKHRAGVMMMSAAAAYYSYEYLAQITGMPTGLVSFIVGLFASPAIERLAQDLSQFSFLSVLAKLVGFKNTGDSK